MTGASPTLSQKQQALCNCAAFAAAPAADLALLAEIMQTESLRTGELLFHRGDVSDRVYLIVSGRMGIYLAGQDVPVRTLGPGELVGEYAMLAEMERTALVRAEEQAVLMSLDNDRFLAFLEHCPKVALSLLKATVRRLIEAEQRAGVLG